MKKTVLILACVALGTCALYAGSPEMDEMKRQYELEQQKCQEYGGGKNAVYKGNTYGTSSSTETKGPTNTYKGGVGVGASVGTSTKADGKANFDYTRTGSQENKSSSDNRGNRWECE